MPSVTFRPIEPDDLPFLREVYAGTRREELAVVGWPPAQVEAFLDQQFDAQHRHYQATFADASFDVVLVDGAPAGRLYVHHRPDEIRVVDVALLPGHRNGGLGTGLLRDLLDEGAARGVPVTIHVEKMNPALRLYRRLGFVEAADRGVYWFMERRPPAPAGG